MTKSFERVGVSSERVTKSFKRVGVSSERVTKSFERMQIFFERFTNGCKWNPAQKRKVVRVRFPVHGHIYAMIFTVHTYIRTSGWIFQKVLAEIVQKGLILSQKALV